MADEVGGVRGTGRPPAMRVRGMFWTLSRKVSAALAAILLSTMLLTAAFGYYKFQDVLSAQVSSRYSFVVFTIKKAVEDRLNLGLALRQLRQVQETIEREKARDPSIMGIQIFDARGEVLFNTDRGGVGGSVPKEWLGSLDGPATQPFSHLDEDALVVGLPLVNNLGKVEGAVALAYPASYLEREMGGLLGALAIQWLVVLAVFVIIAVVGALVMFRGVGQRLSAMEGTLEKVMAEGGDAIPDPTEADAFETRFAEFVAKARETTEHLREATQDVERMDRLV